MSTQPRDRHFLNPSKVIWISVALCLLAPRVPLNTDMSIGRVMLLELRQTLRPRPLVLADCIHRVLANVGTQEADVTDHTASSLTSQRPNLLGFVRATGYLTAQWLGALAISWRATIRIPRHVW